MASMWAGRVLHLSNAAISRLSFFISREVPLGENCWMDERNAKVCEGGDPAFSTYYKNMLLWWNAKKSRGPSLSGRVSSVTSSKITLPPADGKVYQAGIFEVSV